MSSPPRPSSPVVIVPSSPEHVHPDEHVPSQSGRAETVVDDSDGEQEDKTKHDKEEEDGDEEEVAGDEIRTKRRRIVVVEDEVGATPPKPPPPPVMKEKRPASESTTCNICFDSWKSTGSHRICCLKCGHLFGKSCIDRWLKNNQKCPTCNARARKNDVRVLFVSRIVAADPHEIDALKEELAAARDEITTMQREKEKVLLQMEAMKRRHERTKAKLDQQMFQNQHPPVPPQLAGYPSSLVTRTTPDRARTAPNPQGFFTASHQLHPPTPRALTSHIPSIPLPNTSTLSSLSSSISYTSSTSSTSPSALPTPHLTNLMHEPSSPSLGVPLLQDANPDTTPLPEAPRTPSLSSFAKTITNMIFPSNDKHQLESPRSGPEKHARLSPSSSSSLSTSTSSTSASTSTSSSSSSSISPQSRTPTTNFEYKLAESLHTEGSRVLEFCSTLGVILASSSAPGTVGPSSSQGLLKISGLDPRYSDYIPNLHTKPIRDIKFGGNFPLGANGPNHNLAITVSLDKTLKLVNIHTKNVALEYATDAPVWSCEWDRDTPHIMYCGLVNGTVLVFDVRQTRGYMERCTGPNRMPVHSLCYIPPLAGYGSSSQPSQASPTSSPGCAGGILCGTVNGTGFWAKGSSVHTYHALPLEGACTTTVYDSASGHCLATTRSSPLFPY
eukprot:TRINITY_DN5649_c0_g1_i2.p1 TRINITY_DN5649_c0_g1~~TRINITY_DN5649_c0_g1_i2.p1  ORF type:complete len:669 (-),score=188.81 TRINITY_DN5649_c0_g1_i2:88-2094(-)